MSGRNRAVAVFMSLVLSLVMVLPAAADDNPPDAPTPTPEVTSVPEEGQPTEEATEVPTEEPTAVPTDVTQEPTPAPDATIEPAALVVEAAAGGDEQPLIVSLLVKKWVDTEFVRSWRWAIEKTADATNLTMMPGQQQVVTYTVTVSGTPVDSGWTMSGHIAIVNPSGETATIESVTDEADGVVASVSCQVGGNGVGIPFDLPAGWSAVCEYHAALPDGSNRTNVATVSTSGPVPGGSASAAVTFGAPSSETDECIDVTDSLGGALGTVCGGSHTYSYSLPVGPFEVCGDYTVDNVAAFRANDSGASGSDGWTVDVSVPCAGGCSLTPGYWKTHSSYGSAPYDDTWALVGEDTAFFSSGKTYYQALWTSPNGNAYWILAHAYIAAKLNQLNGADFSAAQAAFDSATALFSNPSYTPTYIGGLRGSSPLRQTFISLATILDNYNNGLIGPGHCSE